MGCRSPKLKVIVPMTERRKDRDRHRLAISMESVGLAKKGQSVRGRKIAGTDSQVLGVHASF